MKKPRNIKVIKREKGEKVEIYHCSSLEVIGDKVFINSKKDLLIIGKQEKYKEETK